MEVTLVKTILEAAPSAFAVVAVIGVVILFLKHMKTQEERQNQNFKEQSTHHYKLIVGIGEECHTHQTKLADDYKITVDRAAEKEDDSSRRLSDVIEKNTGMLGELKGVISRNGKGRE